MVFIEITWPPFKLFIIILCIETFDWLSSVKLSFHVGDYHFCVLAIKFLFVWNLLMKHKMSRLFVRWLVRRLVCRLVCRMVRCLLIYLLIKLYNSFFYLFIYLCTVNPLINPLEFIKFLRYLDGGLHITNYIRGAVSIPDISGGGW